MHDAVKASVTNYENWDQPEDYQGAVERLADITDNPAGEVKAHVGDGLAGAKGLEQAASAYGVAVDEQWNAQECADETMRAWAASAGDTHLWSVALQQAAAERFGVDAGRYAVGGDAEREVVHDASIPKEAMAPLRGVTDSVLAEVHERTQAALAKAGIETVRVYRGVALPSSALPEGLAAGDVLGLQMRPLSSWTLDPGKARDFAKWGESGVENPLRVTLVADIPRERIVSTAATGFGCMREAEIVVMGGVGDVATVAEVKRGPGH